MKKQTKISLIVLAVVIVVAAVFAGVYLKSRPATSAGAKTYTVTVTHSDESTKEFTYHTDEEFLGAALLNEGLIEGEQGDYGLYITTVDGESAVYETDGAYWALFQNDEYAMQGVDETPVNDGDSFALVYVVG